MRRLLTGTNYCGLGGDGEPLGEIDQACKTHDEAYGRAGSFSYIENQKADKMFLSDLDKATPHGVRQYVTKKIAQGFFSVKVAVNDNMKPEKLAHLWSNAAKRGEVTVYGAHRKHKYEISRASFKQQRDKIANYFLRRPRAPRQAVYGARAKGRFIRRAKIFRPRFRTIRNRFRRFRRYK